VVAVVVEVVVKVVVTVVVAIMVTPPLSYWSMPFNAFHLLPIRMPLTPARASADSSISDLDGKKWRQQQHHQQHTGSNSNLKVFHKSHFALFLCSGKKEPILGGSLAVCLPFF
jgi:hypothetical protein